MVRHTRCLLDYLLVGFDVIMRGGQRRVDHRSCGFFDGEFTFFYDVVRFLLALACEFVSSSCALLSQLIYLECFVCGY